MKKMNLAVGMIVCVMSAAMLAGCGGSSTAETAKNSQAVESTKAAETESVRTESVLAAESAVVESAAVESAAVESTTAETAKATESVANAQPLDITAESGQISVDDAKKVALADVGLAESDVVFKKAALETEDGVQIYEVDFYANDTEFDYDIDPAAAAIIKVETEPMDADDYTEMEALQGRAADPAKAAAGITEDMALEIALKDAGVAKSDISSPTVTLEHDDDMNRMEYDVEFHVGTTEYSYAIDPDTGAIFESEVDTDD